MRSAPDVSRVTSPVQIPAGRSSVIKPGSVHVVFDLAISGGAVNEYIYLIIHNLQ
jgi:hypothetical protein